MISFFEIQYDNLSFKSAAFLLSRVVVCSCSLSVMASYIYSITADHPVNDSFKPTFSSPIEILCDECFDVSMQIQESMSVSIAGCLVEWFWAF